MSQPLTCSLIACIYCQVASDLSIAAFYAHSVGHPPTTQTSAAYAQCNTLPHDAPKYSVTQYCSTKNNEGNNGALRLG